MNTRIDNSRRRFLLAALGAAGAARGRAEEPKVVIPEYNKISDENEIKLGREAAEGIEKEQKLSFIELPRVQEYVHGIFQKIVKTSRRPNLPYSIKIVDTKEINAFALPGGFVYLNRGLIEWSRNESEMVSVLSHEVGHVVGRHGANAVARAASAQSLLTEFSRVILGDDAPAKILMQIGGPMALLALLKYSRTQELEADLFGFYNLQRAGWSPQGMIDLFKHFGEKAGPADGLLTILGTHPAPAERESQAVEEMKKFPPAPNLVRDSEGFKACQAEVKRLPPPKVTKRLAPE
jgi:predicted Zn-dependent protease